MPRQDSNLRFRPGRSRVNTRADCVDGQQTAAPVPRMVTRVWSPAMSAVPHNMTIARAESLPAVVDVVTVAANLGIGATAAYELIRTGAWPTPGTTSWQAHTNPHGSAPGTTPAPQDWQLGLPGATRRPTPGCYAVSSGLYDPHRPDKTQCRRRSAVFPCLPGGRPRVVDLFSRPAISEQPRRGQGLAHATTRLARGPGRLARAPALPRHGARPPHPGRARWR